MTKKSKGDCEISRAKCNCRFKTTLFFAHTCKTKLICYSLSIFYNLQVILSGLCNHSYFGLNQMINRYIVGLLISMAVSLSVHAKPIVISTTNIIHDLVENLAGNQLQTEALMGPHIDPHYYKASFGDMRKMSRADLIFYNGFELEGRMQSVLENLAALKPTYALASFIPESKILFENQVADPHFWHNVQLWRITAEGVYNTLSKHFPQYQAEFKQNFERYDQQLIKLDEWIRSQISSVPPEQRVLITAHDAFGYFGEAYEIEVLGLQGLNTTSELGLKDLRLMKDIITQRNVKAVFVEASVPARTIEALIAGVQAEGGHVKKGGELLSDALGSPSSQTGTYIGMMQHNTQTLVEALK
jgi:manganese/zinc/iron transport system substrate-binding protein